MPLGSYSFATVLIQSQKLMEMFQYLYLDSTMSEPDFPYSKKPNKPKKSPTPPPPTPSPDLPPGHPPNTPPIKTLKTTKRSRKTS